MKEHSLELKFNGQSVFTSDGKWLYPLFDLEDFLEEQSYDPDRLVLYDKVIGKASSLLITRLGIKNVIGGIISKPAEIVFDTNSIMYTTGRVVEFIDCRTEHILMDISDPDEAYIILKTRAGFSTNE